MFAENLKKLRNSKGVTQVEFAKIFNISSGTIAMWETGKRIPDIGMLKKIADYFDVSVDSLLYDTPKNNDNTIDGVYLSLAKSAQEEGIDPDDIKLAIETIKAMKRQKKGGE